MLGETDRPARSKGPLAAELPRCGATISELVEQQQSLAAGRPTQLAEAEAEADEPSAAEPPSGTVGRPRWRIAFRRLATSRLGLVIAGGTALGLASGAIYWNLPGDVNEADPSAEAVSPAQDLEPADALPRLRHPLREALAANAAESDTGSQPPTKPAIAATDRKTGNSAPASNPEPDPMTQTVAGESAEPQRLPLPEDQALWSSGDVLVEIGTLWQPTLWMEPQGANQGRNRWERLSEWISAAGVLPAAQDAVESGTRPPEADAPQLPEAEPGVRAQSSAASQAVPTTADLLAELAGDEVRIRVDPLTSLPRLTWPGAGTDDPAAARGSSMAEDHRWPFSDTARPLIWIRWPGLR